MKFFKILMTSTLILSVLFLGRVSKSADDCGTWRVEIENRVTKETKLFSYSPGEERTIPIPDLKKFQCSILVGKSEGKIEGTAATLTCSPKNKKENWKMATTASCLDHGGGTIGLFSVTDMDFKTSKSGIVWFNFTLSPRSN